MKALLRFPEGEGDVFVPLDCDADLQAAGSLYGTYCLAFDNRYVEYERAVGSATNFAVAESAMVDGKRRDVWFQFRVEFERRKGREEIRIFPNQGLQSGTFGVDYSGPQRLESSRSRFFSDSCPTKMRLWATATVTEEGKPEGIAVESKGVGGAACRATLAEAIRRSRFIPAFVSGQPVRGLYREIFFTPSSARRVGRGREWTGDRTAAPSASPASTH